MARTSNTTQSNSSVRCNPVLRGLYKINETAVDGERATYGGVSQKTMYFLITTVAGMIVYYLLALIYFDTLTHFTGQLEGLVYDITTPEIVIGIGAGIGAIVFALICSIGKRGIPIFGTLYTLCEGYLLAWLISDFLVGYEYLALEALVITGLIVASMLFLYTKRIVKVTNRFKTILFSAIISLVLISIVGFVLALIPATSGLVSAFAANPIISIGFSLIGVVVASLFLMVDFNTVEQVVEKNLPKKYEWYCAFGIAFTIIWVYVKVLDLLLSIKEN